MFKKLLHRLFKSKTIMAPDRTPYLTRFYIANLHFFRIYIHQFHASDSDRHMHDHPFWFLSLILWGGYIERLPDRVRTCRPGRIIFHRAADLHSVTLRLKQVRKNVWAERPAWTLIIAGPKTRVWGFQTETGWVDFETYLKAKFGPDWKDASEEMED